MQRLSEPPLTEINYNANIRPSENYKRFMDWRLRADAIQGDIYLNLSRELGLAKYLKDNYSQRELQEKPVHTLKNNELARALSYIEAINDSNKEAGKPTSFNGHTLTLYAMATYCTARANVHATQGNICNTVIGKVKENARLSPGG